jgi:hypothetical protein
MRHQPRPRWSRSAHSARRPGPSSGSRSARSEAASPVGPTRQSTSVTDPVDRGRMTMPALVEQFRCEGTKLFWESRRCVVGGSSCGCIRPLDTRRQLVHPLNRRRGGRRTVATKGGTWRTARGPRSSLTRAVADPADQHDLRQRSPPRRRSPSSWATKTRRKRSEAGPARRLHPRSSGPAARGRAPRAREHLNRPRVFGAFLV